MDAKMLTVVVSEGWNCLCMFFLYSFLFLFTYLYFTMFSIMNMAYLYALVYAGAAIIKHHKLDCLKQ